MDLVSFSHLLLIPHRMAGDKSGHLTEQEAAPLPVPGMSESTVAPADLEVDAESHPHQNLQPRSDIRKHSIE